MLSMIHKWKSLIRPLPLLVLSLVLVAVFFVLTGRNSDLRGTWKASKDGNTYLVVKGDDEWTPTAIHVDGAIWPHRAGVAGRIAPGIHSINCCGGGEYGFQIPRGVVYTFNYWGP